MGGRDLEREGSRKDGIERALECRTIMAQADPRRRDCCEREDELLNRRLEVMLVGMDQVKRPLLGLLSRSFTSWRLASGQHHSFCIPRTTPPKD